MNDYYQMTKEYLSHYHEYKALIRNLNDDIDNELDNASKLNYLLEIDTPSVCSEKIKEKRRVERVMKRVDRELEMLPPDDSKLVKGFYLEGKSWEELAAGRKVSEKWIRERTSKAIKRMSDMIFYDALTPEQQKFFPES